MRMRKNELKEKNERNGTMAFRTRFRELTIFLSTTAIKNTDKVGVEISYKILQKRHPIKQKRDFDRVLFELLPRSTQGRFTAEELLAEGGQFKLKTDYEKIRELANEEMQRQMRSANRQPEKQLYKFISENPWNLRENWIIKTILDWQQGNFEATTKAERDAYRKKLEGIGKYLVVRAEKNQGIRQRIKDSFRYPRWWVDTDYWESRKVFDDLRNLMTELGNLKTKKEKKDFLEDVLSSSEPREEFHSYGWNYPRFRQEIREYFDDIIDTSKQGKKGQITEWALEITSEIFKLAVGTLKKNLFEQDRAVEFEVKIFVNNQPYEKWKI